MTLLTDAKRHILEAMYDPTRTGICVVAASRKLNRMQLMVETVDQYAGEPDQSKDYFRSLFVSRDPERLERLQNGMRRRRSGARHTLRRLEDYVYSAPMPTVPQPRELSFIRMRHLLALAPHFPSECLELLVLDELQQGEMVNLLPFMERAQPLFTLLAMSQEPPADSPWRQRFGEPLIVRGPAQTPPWEPPATDPAKSG